VIGAQAASRMIAAQLDTCRRLAWDNKLKAGSFAADDTLMATILLHVRFMGLCKTFNIWPHEPRPLPVRLNNKIAHVEDCRMMLAGRMEVFKPCKLLFPINFESFPFFKPKLHSASVAWPPWRRIARLAM
jgi:hypothetical protein